MHAESAAHGHCVGLLTSASLAGWVEPRSRAQHPVWWGGSTPGVLAHRTSRRLMYNYSPVPGACGIEGHGEGEAEGGVENMAHTADVVIIGGGIIGASIAYHLRQDGLSGRLIIIERDTTYARATTPMSMGGVRQQYATPCNIALARYSLQFYEQFDELMVGAWGRPQAHFHQCGYLFLFNESQRPTIMQ